MLLATLGGLIWPALTRMSYVAGRPVAMFGLLISLVLAPAVYDRFSSRRFQPVSLWGGVLVLAAFLQGFRLLGALLGTASPRGFFGVELSITSLFQGFDTVALFPPKKQVLILTQHLLFVSKSACKLWIAMVGASGFEPQLCSGA